jgi:general nucleoside transport system permease protein
MSSTSTPISHPSSSLRNSLRNLGNVMAMPLLATLAAFILGAMVIFATSLLSGNSLAASLTTVGEAYWGLLRGAFFKERGFSESLVATTPYILLSLGVGVGFLSGLFNIGVEGQFYIGSICAAWAGASFHGLPAILHLPLALLVGAAGGAVWAAIPGYLKARTGAHEVISTMMMNYIAFRLSEYVVSGPLRDKQASATQTPRVDSAAEVWTLSMIPERLKDPLNAFMVALVIGLVVLVAFRFWVNASSNQKRFSSARQRRMVYFGAGLAAAVITFIVLPPLSRIWWPFNDQYDRMHIGFFIALGMAVLVWWLMWKTTLGFELRTVGANPHAARYAGVNITRNIVITMAVSGALAGLAGAIEVLGVSICRCLPLFFSSGYGFDSIAISLLAKNNPFGIIAASFLFGAMRNGADFMELNSGVSKYIISLIQALALLFVAAPAIARWMFRIKAEKLGEDETPAMRGWGG